MTSFESIFTPPIAWVAARLERLAVPGGRAVVLVPAERLAHAIRRHVCVECRQPGLLAGVLFLRPVALARELILRAGTARLWGWEDIRRLRILQLFESAALGARLRYFNAEQLRSGQGYVDAFARTIADLEASGLDAALAFTVADLLSAEDPLAADRLHDVAVTWQAADAAATLATTPQLLAHATELVAARPELVLPFGPVVAVLTASPSTRLLRFLRTLPSCDAVLQDARPLREQTQRWRALLGRTGQEVPLHTASADQGTFALRPATNEPFIVGVGADASELQLVQRYLFELPETLTDPQRPRSRGADGSVDIEEYPGIEDEIEAAATWVTEQIAAGTPLEQIALVVPDTDPYGALLLDRLRRVTVLGADSGVPVHVAGGLSVAASPAGVRLLALLHAIGHGLDAESTIRILPALRRGDQAKDDLHTRLSPSRAAEIVYGAGIVGGSPGDPAGVREWMPRLQHRRDALQALLAQTDTDNPDEPEKRHHSIDRQEAQRWLRDMEPILPAVDALQQLAEAALDATPLHTVWQRLLDFCERWLRIPPDPPNVMARLAESLQPVLADTVARTISGTAALRFLSDTVHRERYQETRFGEPCVFIGTGSQAAGVPFAAVRVLGLGEGALPHTPHDDPIVPDGLRARIERTARAQQATPDIVVPRLADHVLDEIHDVFRVVRSAGSRLALSVPRQWVDRSEREVSGILLEVATALGRTVERQPNEGDVPTAARLRAAYLRAGRTVRQRAATAHPLSPRARLASVSGPPASIAGAATVPEAFAVPASWLAGASLAVDQLRRLAILSESDALGGIDGVVTEAWSTVVPPGLAPPRPISASGLTTLLGCPHRFLLERILHLSGPVQRPPTDTIAPLAYGSLFHAAAERFFHEAGAALCRHEGHVDHWVARARQIAAEAFDALQHEYPMRGADTIQRERDRLLRQIEQLVHYEWQLPPREFLDSELDFGEPIPVCLELDSGPLYLRGAVDRVDRMGADALSVRDLKTGRVRDLGEDPVNAARDLQIGLYVLALEASGYGSQEGRPGRVAAAAYVHPSAAQEPERVFSGSALDVLREHTRAWLAMARQLLAGGHFPRTPNADDCLYCPFVAACGDGAQARSAAKLSRLPAGHVLETFVRFKRRRSEEEG